MPPLDDSKQRPLFDVRQFVPQPYPAGSFYDVLERYSGAIIQRRDFPDPGPDFGGQTRWCPVLLSKLVLIQAKHGWRDRETVQRGCTDLQVKACLGLGVEQEGPSQPTLCRHRQLMADLGLDEVYEQRWSALMLALGLLERDEAVLVDSVPVHGAGQVLDTYNLLGAAIRKSLRALARAHGQSETRVAGELDLARYLDRNVKGSFDIDWDDPQARLALLDQLVTDAQRVEEALRSLASDVTRQPAEQAPSPRPKRPRPTRLVCSAGTSTRRRTTREARPLDRLRPRRHRRVTTEDRRPPKRWMRRPSSSTTSSTTTWPSTTTARSRASCPGPRVTGRSARPTPICAMDARARRCSLPASRPR